MKNLKITYTLIFVSLMFVLSCNNESENLRKTKSSKVRYIEAFCGGLMTTNNQLVTSSCGMYQDSLLVAINKDDFAIFQSLQFNDEISIVYEISTEFCEGGPGCEVMGNRSNGVPIRIINYDIE